MLRLFEDVRASADATALHTNMRSAACQLGFDSFHYASHSAVKATGADARFLFDGVEQKSAAVISDFPDPWFARYQERNYIDIDPLVAHCARSILPAIWHAQGPASTPPKAAAMFDEAREHGLALGATFSVFGDKREMALLSLTTGRTGERERLNIEARLGDGHLLLAYVHETAKQLRARGGRQPDGILLTPRERECLLWVAVGKTSWEIARILSISERTVVFHIDNVNRKLGSNTRAQTVAKALAVGLIDP